jgi:micrococcal nuclease
LQKNNSWKIVAGVLLAATIGFAGHDLLETPKISQPEIKNVEVCECRNEVVYRAKVTRVIDGDTLELADGNKVRIKGMDTPENTSKVEPFGPESTRVAREILEGKTVGLKITQNEVCDRFGRFLRVIYFTDENGKQEDFALYLIKKGLAQVYVAKDSPERKKLCAAEKNARDKKLKMWSTKKTRAIFEAKKRKNYSCD